MHCITPSSTQGIAQKGTFGDLYTPATRPASDLWRVEMDVNGLLWWPTWTGYAFSSQHATDSAIAWFQGINGPLKTTVRAVFQVGV